MTAADNRHDDDEAVLAAHIAADANVARVGLTCQTATGGRRAVRALAVWAQRFNLTEPDFQLLWSLRLPSAEGLDQAALARRLAYSPAQVSATVERLRSSGWIVPRQSSGDRRRHRWQLSDSGSRLLNEMLAAAGLLAYDTARENETSNARHNRRKGAA